MQLELQITTYLIAILYQLFGYHYALARIVPVLFFMGSAFFLYRIGRLYFPERTALFAVALYGVLPLNILYSRAIMPESAALFFMLGAFVFFTLWIRRDRLLLLLLAGLFTGVVAAEKIPTLFIGIPMLAMTMAKYKLRMLWKRELWLFAFLALVLPLLYFGWLGTVAESAFVSGIASKHVLAGDVQRDRDAGSLAVLLSRASFCIYLGRADPCPVGASAAEVAGSLPDRRLGRCDDRGAGHGGGRHQVRLLSDPDQSGRCPARGCSALRSVRRPSGPDRSSGASAGGLRKQLPQHSSDVRFPAYGADPAGELVQQATDKQDLIVVGTPDPALLNASHRRGWRVANALPDNPVAELNSYIGQGAKYFVPLKGYIYGDDGSFRQYLDSHYDKIDFGEGYFIYKLKAG
ncbi:glycosyltransferase family 39 protein [Paenibacillus sp. P25]|nr:glycosyltransferase family 39 protein [Paenibacillus sp. P25]